MRIALITEGRYLVDPGTDPLIDNILVEEGLLAGALADLGVDSQRVDWRDAGVRWQEFDAAVLRSPWSYSEHLADFRGFVTRCASATALLNPAQLVHWNLDKRYLIELQSAGVPVVPTVVHDPTLAGHSTCLERRIAELGWPEAVVKPVISAGGRQTHRVGPKTSSAQWAQLQALSRCEPLLLQPFLPSILDAGEFTIVMIEGQYSHAVCKRPAPGEFRVQDDHGGTLHAFAPSPTELEFARAAMAACPLKPLYGRVDFVQDASAAPALMEIELIEPELWFRRRPAAAAEFANALRDRARSSSR